MKLLNTSSCRSFFNLIPYICGSSLIYNTSARHKRYECDTSVTLATRVRHEQHKCNTSATQVLHERNERDTSATRTTQMQHEWKKLILISTRVKTLSTPLYLLDCNWTRTQNHLVCKRTLNHLAKLAKWLSVRLRTKWFWVQVQLHSLKLQYSRLLRARSSMTFRQL